jgi:acyl-CoA synthetase (NDP forming)
MGAGGATCFASGFLESEAEGTGGADLQAKLVAAAGEMPILGPNCYGLLNYLDNVTLWPDQHGGTKVGRGVAIIAQSSNIAINMTMQRRLLPIAYVVAAGNQAQTGTAEIATALLEDDRVSAIGLYLEGFGDIRALESFAARARAAGKPVVALKIGRSEKAQAATMTHTASLAGNSAASSALLKRLGIIEVNSIGVFLETLKLMDAIGPLPGNSIVSVSCSGGEASLMADLGSGTAVSFRDLSDPSRKALKDLLGPIVTIANPLDYHTFIWGDTQRMTDVFGAVMGDRFDLAVFVLDMPRDDRCDPSGYQCAVDAIIAARKRTGARVAVLASLPENMPEHFAAKFAEHGIVPLHGMEEGLPAIAAAISAGSFPKAPPPPVLLSAGHAGPTLTLGEAEAKERLRAHGLESPGSAAAKNEAGLAVALSGLKFPVVLKGMGIAHKSEAGAVVLNLQSEAEVLAAAQKMASFVSGFLVEEMVTGGVAEIIAGITRDATGTLMLTVGAGGVLTELLADTTSLLLPASKAEIRNAILSLKAAKLITGFRGRPAGDLDGLVEAVHSICAYAEAKAQKLVELDVNPLIVSENGAVAVDALIVLSRE